MPPEDLHWQNLMRLMQAVYVVTSFYCRRDTQEMLQIRLATYNQEFVRLYPRASVKPKMHYALHIPEQMRMYGPTRHHWCMRFEGKHGFYKRKK